MKPSFFAKTFVLLLGLSLVFGQGLPGMAASARLTEQLAKAMQEMDISVSSSHSAHDTDCFSHAQKHNSSKPGMCSLGCGAGMQTATLPYFVSTPALYAVENSYDKWDTSAAGQDILPAPPYPKA